MGAGCTCGTSGDEVSNNNVKSRSNTEIDKQRLLETDDDSLEDQSMDEHESNRMRTSMSTAPLDGDAMAELVDAVDHGFTPMSAETTAFFPDVEEVQAQAQRDSAIMAGIMSGSPSTSAATTTTVASCAVSGAAVTASAGESTNEDQPPTTQKRRSIVDELLDADSIAVIESMDTSNRASLVSGSDSSSLAEESTKLTSSDSEIKRLRTQTEAEVYYRVRAEKELEVEGDEEQDSDDEINEKMHVFQKVLKEQMKEVDEEHSDSEEREQRKTVLRQQSLYKWSSQNMDEQKEQMMQQLLYLQAVAGGGDTDLEYVQKLMAEREALLASGSPPPPSAGGAGTSSSITEGDVESEDEFASSSEQE